MSKSPRNPHSFISRLHAQRKVTPTLGQCPLPSRQVWRVPPTGWLVVLHKVLQRRLWSLITVLLACSWRSSPTHHGVNFAYCWDSGKKQWLQTTGEWAWNDCIEMWRTSQCTSWAPIAGPFLIHACQYRTADGGLGDDGWLNSLLITILWAVCCGYYLSPCFFMSVSHLLYTIIHIVSHCSPDLSVSLYGTYESFHCYFTFFSLQLF